MRSTSVAAATKLRARVAISSESKVFGALVLLVGAVVVGVVAYDIYLHPPGPEQVGVATIVISGEGRFNGEVGTEANLYTIEATSPATVKVPYSLADYVVADIEQDLVWVEIRVKKKTVEKGAGNTLMWKPGIR
jgi:uncharacterized phage protein gp47/JayE